MFEREELWRIEQRANKEASIVVNPDWKRALEDLAYAANVVDAHIGRSSVGVPEEIITKAVQSGGEEMEARSTSCRFDYKYVSPVARKWWRDTFKEIEESEAAQVE